MPTGAPVVPVPVADAVPLPPKRLVPNAEDLLAVANGEVVPKEGAPPKAEPEANGEEPKPVEEMAFVNPSDENLVPVEGGDPADGAVPKEPNALLRFGVPNVLAGVPNADEPTLPLAEEPKRPPLAGDVLWATAVGIEPNGFRLVALIGVEVAPRPKPL